MLAAMDRLANLEAFVRVADTQSFSDAARQLGVARSVVTKRVQQLEDELDARLFHRTTRIVRLSAAGTALYRDAAELVTRARQLAHHMRELKDAPSGLLRVHALPGFAIGGLGEVLREFQERHPAVVLELVISDAIIDPARERFDCVLQIFAPISDRLVARKLVAWRPVFCASPDYLRRHGEPRRPAELAGRRLGLYSRYPTRDRWKFRRGKQALEFELEPVLRSNSVHVLRDYALADAGIVCIPTLVASEYLLDGRLRVVLRDYAMETFWLCAVYPSARDAPLRLRRFLDAIAPRPIALPAWDRPLIERGLIAR
jgi:DNA-binding transcriptional LysR family regulator